MTREESERASPDLRHEHAMLKKVASQKFAAVPPCWPRDSTTFGAGIAPPEKRHPTTYKHRKPTPPEASVTEVIDHVSNRISDDHLEEHDGARGATGSVGSDRGLSRRAADIAEPSRLTQNGHHLAADVTNRPSFRPYSPEKMPSSSFGSNIDLGLGQPVGMARARPAGLESVGREALRPPGSGKCASAASRTLIPRVEHDCLVASMAT